MPRKPGLLLLLMFAMLLGGAAAFAVTPSDVIVEDRAGVLDRHTLVPAIDAIEFHTPTKVAVYTYNGSAADNLNEEVLRFARAEHPDWISPDGQKWTDGLFIFALDPVGRHVGTYMGEDRKVSLEQRDDIQNAAKELGNIEAKTDGPTQATMPASIGRPSASAAPSAAASSSAWHAPWAALGAIG